MMKKYTKKDVLEAIAKMFPDEPEGCVLDLLNAYGRESYEHEHERVHMAILKLSGGDTNNLLKYIQLAKTDYRDVLYLAEYSK